MSDGKALWVQMIQENTSIERKLRKTWEDWEVEFTQKVAPLLIGEILDVSAIKQDALKEGTCPAYGLCIIEYDFFGPGYTAYVPLEAESIEELYRFIERDPEDGREAWLCRYRSHVPWLSQKQNIEASGLWNCEELAAGRGIEWMWTPPERVDA